MLIKEYLTNDFKPLSPRDSIEVARLLFESFRYDYLPIVDNGLLIGCLPSDFNLGVEEKYFVSEFIEESDSFFVQKTTNLIDTLRVSAITDSNFIPVTDSNNQYLGYVTQYDIMTHFSNTPFFSELGGIIVIKKSLREYSVSEIAQIVESENARILGLFINDLMGGEVVITLKINQMRLGAIEASLQRYGYYIVESYHENRTEDDMQDRYDSLMNYLDV